MDSATRSRFLHQLSLWAGDYIAQGRSPFRKTEIAPTLLTRQGQLMPDLVFWINQDSFVAGGFVIFPDSEDVELKNAQACAHSLGVRYFASWTKQHITFWHADDLSIHKQLAAPAADVTEQIDAFEAALVQLMDEFRTLAVLGACPPHELSYWHLTNLCLGVLHKALPGLSEHFRRSPELHQRHLAPLQTQAEDKLLISTARLLSLLFFDKIPYNIQPEKLDHALRYLTSELPQEEFGCLSPPEFEPDLDERSGVLFHHLLRRLDQIAIFKNPQRSAEVLRQLLHFSAPCQQLPDENTPCDIQLYGNSVPSDAPHFVEIDQPARLALKHLFRRVKDWPLGQHHGTDIFQLSTEQTALQGSACLFNETVLDTSHRNTCKARLRVVWPGQALEFNRSTPTWVFELCYLLGIMPEGSHLHLHLPLETLCGPFSAQLVTLMQEHFTVHEISQPHDKVIRLQATKQLEEAAEVRFAGDHHRTVSWSRLRRAEPEWLGLTLQLPSPLYQLLEKGLLRFTNETPDRLSKGLDCYYLSSLALRFQEALSASSGTSSRRSKWTPRIPKPSASVLKTLGELALEGLSAAEQQKRVDLELARLLDTEVTSAGHLPSRKKNSSSPEQGAIDKKELQNRIIQAVKVRGLPEFPTHYLYDFFRPPLTEYPHERAPWTIDNEFMGTFTLKDLDGKELTISEEYLAHGLVLASYGSKPPQLPDDPAICTAIVSRYLADLADIHTMIWRESHAGLPDSTAANRLVSKIWRGLTLPPWPMVEKFLQRFQISPTT
jgi:hypothetical protein